MAFFGFLGFPEIFRQIIGSSISSIIFENCPQLSNNTSNIAVACSVLNWWAPAPTNLQNGRVKSRTFHLKMRATITRSYRLKPQLIFSWKLFWYGPFYYVFTNSNIIHSTLLLRVNLVLQFFGTFINLNLALGVISGRDFNVIVIYIFEISNRFLALLTILVCSKCYLLTQKLALIKSKQDFPAAFFSAT